MVASTARFPYILSEIQKKLVSSDCVHNWIFFPLSPHLLNYIDQNGQIWRHFTFQNCVDLQHYATIDYSNVPRFPNINFPEICPPHWSTTSSRMSVERKVIRQIIYPTQKLRNKIWPWRTIRLASRSTIYQHHFYCYARSSRCWLLCSCQWKAIILPFPFAFP